MTSSSPLQQTVNWIRKSSNILILTHKKIDGDALASTIALYSVLKKLNKNVTAVCEDPIPEVFQFLPMHDVIHNSLSSTRDFVVSVATGDAEVDSLRYTIEEGKINIFISPKKGEILQKDISFTKRYNKYDLVIVLDTPELEALGSIYEKNIDLFFSLPLVNIDHKVSNTYFGKINLVDVTASSTAEILMHLFSSLPEKDIFDEDLATLLLTGIIVDTGSFQNPNTTPKSFATASRLIGMGARQQEIIKHIYKTKKLSTLKLWGKILGNVKNDPIFRFLWSSISYKDIPENKNALAEVIQLMDSLLSNTPGAEIIVMLFEDADQYVHTYIKTINQSIDPTMLISLLGGRPNFEENKTILEVPLFEAEVETVSKIREFQSTRLGIPINQAVHPDQPMMQTEGKKRTTVDTTLPVFEANELERSLGNSLNNQVSGSS